MSEQAPMTWEQALKEKAQEQAMRKAALSTGPKYVSFKSGILSIDKIPIPNNTLDVVVLNFMSENAYYKGRFDPTKPQTPVCWSVYADEASMVPNEDAAEIQAEKCSECPMFKWGSDPMGGRGKACKTRIRLGLLPATFSEPSDVLVAELRFGTLPVTSGKDFDSFVTKCNNLFGLPTFAVIASLSVVPDPKNQFKVVLEPKERLSPEYFEGILKRLSEAETGITYPYQDLEDEQPAAATAKSAKKL